MFKVGDKVAYPMHGAGVVEAIEDKMIMDRPVKYYVLKFVMDGMRVMVPVDNADKVGLRYISTKEECDKILQYLSDEASEDGANAYELFKQNLEKLKTGSMTDVAEVIRLLKGKHRERGLSSGEKRMLTQALTILVSEIAFVSEKDPSLLKREIVDFI